VPPAQAQPPEAAAPSTPAPAPVETPAPATEAPPLITAQPSAPAPEPARTPLDRPPLQPETWTAESRVDRSPLLYRGLSLRLSAELGYGKTDRELPAGETQVSGLEGGISLDVGGAVMPDFIVYGRVAGFAFNHASSSDSPNVGTAYYALIGAGARYHFMPFDWYGSGTLGVVAMSVTGDLNQVENAAPGIGLQLETGKNWSSGADDGHGTIGVGLRFTYARCGSVGGIDDPWVTLALSGVFSVAYN
jgi:hypothetical protein